MARIIFNKKAFVEIRQLPEVKADLMKRAKKIAEEAGGEEMGYKVTDLSLEEPRGAVSVMATGKAAYHNRKYNSLVKAIDAGR